MWDWYESLPEWLRWVLFVPVSAICSFIALGIYAVFRADEFAFVKPAFAMLIPMCIVYAFAPRGKKYWALFTLFVRVVVVAILMRLVWAVEGYFEPETLWEIGYETLGYIVSLVVWWKFLHKDA